MNFDWDPEKSRINKIKHGISFEEAMTLWESDYLEVENVARSLEGEVRNATLGCVGKKVYLAIWTPRGNSLRLISVRKARKYEKEIFLKNIQNK
jgi:uncharacterized protein